MPYQYPDAGPTEAQREQSSAVTRSAQEEIQRIEAKRTELLQAQKTGRLSPQQQQDLNGLDNYLRGTPGSSIYQPPTPAVPQSTGQQQGPVTTLVPASARVGPTPEQIRKTQEMEREQAAKDAIKQAKDIEEGNQRERERLRLLQTPAPTVPKIPITQPPPISETPEEQARRLETWKKRTEGGWRPGVTPRPTPAPVSEEPPLSFAPRQKPIILTPESEKPPESIPQSGGGWPPPEAEEKPTLPKVEEKPPPITQEEPPPITPTTSTGPGIGGPGGGGGGWPHPELGKEVEPIELPPIEPTVPTTTGLHGSTGAAPAVPSLLSSYLSPTPEELPVSGMGQQGIYRDEVSKRQTMPGAPESGGRRFDLLRLRSLEDINRTMTNRRKGGL